MTTQRLFVIVGVCAVVLFTFVTPPFQVPDEVGHFWRAESIAHGALFPPMTARGAAAELPKGLASIVLVFWRTTPDFKITYDEFHRARWVRLEPETRVPVILPAGYTPAPYIPQIVAATIGRVVHAIPVVTFYLGRLLNGLAFVAMVAMAIRIAPALRWVFAASGLLPMAMYLAASWSPDAMTIAASLLFTALLLRGARTPREAALLSAAGAFVGLCKPAYFLIALLALVVPIVRGSYRAIIIAATAAGVALAMWSAARAFVPARPGVRIDPAAQIDCIRHDPGVFGDAIVHEARLHGLEYTEQGVGRLGLLDIRLPQAVITAELLLLLLCAWSGVEAPRMPVRLLSLLIVAATVAGIALSSYLGWTAVCARQIDGIQGRYFLPIVPLIFAVVSLPLVRREAIPRIVLLTVSAAANATALAAVIARYYW
ncbi:MAG TPA: DUF2142 domain-containing protein [Thermoanaerobaculia bacterium]|nr:DUF2142 domain-containing protein [Thermoanaerobaculia bacterium]